MIPENGIETQRLTLRSFQFADAKDVQRLAGEREIADTTLNIPHPYEDGMAEAWLRDLRPKIDAGEEAVFAITLSISGELIGAVGLRIDATMSRGGLGYWVGKPYWNKGYCTEAAIRVVQFGFEELDLNRIHAEHLQRNPASGKVMQKIGMSKEGVARQHTVKWGRFEDLVLYGLLREEWVGARDESESQNA